MITIDDCEEKDLKFIKEIKNYYISNTKFNLGFYKLSDIDVLDWFNKIKEKYPVIVAKDNDKLIGYASLGTFREHEGYYKTCEISIYVLNYYKGKGIGALLMEEIIKRAKIYKFHVIVAVITTENASSIKFHEKFGFKIAGNLPEVGYKNEKFLDVTFMTKILE